MADIPRDVLVRAGNGDPEAFERIYDSTGSFVYSVALRITSNRPDAEEVTQDVFMQIFKNLKKFRFESSFKTWVYRIAFNTAVNKYKQAERERGRRQEYGTVTGSEPPAGKDAEFMNKESAEKTVGRLLDKLSPEQKSCIILREIDGLSYKEISRVLKLNMNTVRSRLKRARETILASAGKEMAAHGL